MRRILAGAFLGTALLGVVVVADDYIQRNRIEALEQRVAQLERGQHDLENNSEQNSQSIIINAESIIQLAEHDHVKLHHP